MAGQLRHVPSPPALVGVHLVCPLYPYLHPSVAGFTLLLVVHHAWAPAPPAAPAPTWSPPCTCGHVLQASSDATSMSPLPPLLPCPVLTTEWLDDSILHDTLHSC